MTDYKAILQKYWGYDSFRGIQETIINSIGSGHDTLGLMPTGGGKSITFQVPALAQDGLCLVITPLIALMKDQVSHLKKRGIKAAAIYSGMTREEIVITLENCIFGDYKFLYISPERLSTEIFQIKLRHMRVSFITVDEAHCISQWGYDFRPAYLQIHQIRELLPEAPILALTATATPEVVKDIQKQLLFQAENVFQMSFERQNLAYVVRKTENKSKELLHILRHVKGSAIVYTRSRKGTKEIAQFLQQNNISAEFYHAGLSNDEKDMRQHRWQHDESRVMVATNAFGMGIDKSNVSFVIHYNMPKSIEAYYQEAGRAGRDGAEADCILLFNSGDVQTARFLINNGSDNEEMDAVQREEVRRQDLERLDAMIGYCKTKSCLRGYILDYFGQKHPAMCGNCGSCKGNFQSVDITREAQIILSCVKRVHDALGYNVGANLLGNILRGSRNKRVQELGLDKISTYGLLKDRTRSDTHAMLDHLEAEGYLRTEQEHQSVFLTPAAGEVLYRGKTVTMLVEQTHEPETPVTETAKLTADDAQLFDALKELRLELAKKAEIPAFVVFSNATLADMAKKKPATMSEFKKVSGVGEIKAAWYGTAFLKCIQSYLDENA